MPVRSRARGRKPRNLAAPTLRNTRIRRTVRCIGDKTLTIYYKPDESWGGQEVYVRYTSDNGSGSIAMSAVDVADSTNAAGWYKADLPEGANLSAVKYHFASTQSGESGLHGLERG